MVETLVFVAMTVSIALEPGPNFVKLAFVSGTRGRMAGYRTALGIAIGAAPHIAIVATGLSWLISAAPDILFWLRLAGGAYLIGQAAVMLRPAGHRAADNHVEKPAATRWMYDISGGFWLVVLNPRTIVFYSAYLPLFVDGGASLPLVAQMILLGMAVAMIMLVVDLLFVRAVDRYGSRFAGIPTVRRIFRYLGATALAVLGVRLMT